MVHIVDRSIIWSDVVQALVGVATNHEVAIKASIKAYQNTSKTAQNNSSQPTC